MVDRVGQQLGNYRLIQLLGQGAFAEVYLGEHRYLETCAAIKVLHTRLASDDIEQFRLEARTIARLEHPHIVRVLEFGVEDATPYLVMSYAPNGTLRTLHSKGTRLPLATIISYVKQIAPALQYAHDQKLIHRDIKQENMLLGKSNEVLLSDFGIATVAHRTSTQSIQEAAGTAPYMAPEQFKGMPRFASDQYSLGVVVYEWISGAPPFHGANFIQLGYQHTYEPPPPLHDSLPSLPPAVEQVVLQALAKDPTQRWPSVQAFADALEQASQLGQPAPIPPPSGPSSSPTLNQPLVRTILLLGLALIVIVSSLLIYPRLGITTPTSPITPNQAKITSTVTSPFTVTTTATATAPTATPTQVTITTSAIATLDASRSNPYPPGTGTLLLNDSLKNTTEGWGVTDPSSTDLDCYFTQSAYHLKDLQGQQGSCYYASGPFSNFVYQIQMKFIAANTCGGIVFREHSSSTAFLSTYYDFLICTNGVYQLEALGNPPIARSLGQDVSSAIQKGMGQANVIAVVANGANLDLYINGVEITHVQDSTSSTGQIGVTVSKLVSSTVPVEVAFNDAKVWSL